MSEIISQIEKANLLGRSGSMFPVAKKWKIVKERVAPKKYVVCNASEGEVNTHKDYFILKNFFSEVVGGIKIALDFLEAEEGYLYLNKNYFDEFAGKIVDLGEGRITVFKKEGGYIGGEETSILEAIEGRRPEPRIKPPYPGESGLWGYPTLINNVESFYCVSKISKGEYAHTRFYSINGDAPNKGVFELSEDITIRELLEKTGNIPDFDYFLQIGGGAGGTIVLKEEIQGLITNLASIIIYSREKTDPFLLMEKWAEFFLYGNCDKCTPCREGLYRIMEMIKRKDFKEIDDIFFVLENTSLCPLGRVAASPFRSLIEKVIYNKNGDSN